MPSGIGPPGDQLKSKRLPAWLIVLAFLLGASQPCSLLGPQEAPGEGAKAERGYAACAPILAALAEFREANGNYPDSLTALVPDYLNSIPSQVNDQPITYSKTAASFTLTFGYVGPGMNICTYAPERGWRCSGAH